MSDIESVATRIWNVITAIDDDLGRKDRGELTLKYVGDAWKAAHRGYSATADTALRALVGLEMQICRSLEATAEVQKAVYALMDSAPVHLVDSTGKLLAICSRGVYLDDNDCEWCLDTKAECDQTPRLCAGSEVRRLQAELAKHHACVYCTKTTKTCGMCAACVNELVKEWAEWARQ